MEASKCYKQFDTNILILCQNPKVSGNLQSPTSRSSVDGGQQVLNVSHVLIDLNVIIGEIKGYISRSCCRRWRRASVPCWLPSQSTCHGRWGSIAPGYCSCTGGTGSGLACTDRSCNPSAKRGRQDTQDRVVVERMMMMRGRGEVPGAKVATVGPDEVPGVGKSLDWASTTSTASFRLSSVEASIAASTLLSRWGKRVVNWKRV